MDHLSYLLLAIGLSMAYAAWSEFRRDNKRDGGLLAAFGTAVLLLSASMLSG